VVCDASQKNRRFTSQHRFRVNQHSEQVRFTTGGKVFVVKIESQALAKINQISDQEFGGVKSEWFSAVEQWRWWKETKTNAKTLKKIGKVLDEILPEYKWKPELTLGQVFMRAMNRQAVIASPDFRVPDLPDIKDHILKLLQIEWCRSGLNTNLVATLLRAAVNQAILQNDRKFFISLGRQLSAKAKQPQQASPLVREIFLGWISEGGVAWADGSSWTLPQGFRMGFYCFSDEALEHFLHFTAPDRNPTFESVRKIRQRLKLLRTRRPIIKRVKQPKDVIILS
jgi:hypothetical protein